MFLGQLFTWTNDKATFNSNDLSESLCKQLAVVTGSYGDVFNVTLTLKTSKFKSSRHSQKLALELSGEDLVAVIVQFDSDSNGCLIPSSDAINAQKGSSIFLEETSVKLNLTTKSSWKIQGTKFKLCNSGEISVGVLEGPSVGSLPSVVIEVIGFSKDETDTNVTLDAIRALVDDLVRESHGDLKAISVSRSEVRAEDAWILSRARSLIQLIDMKK